MYRKTTLSFFIIFMVICSGCAKKPIPVQEISPTSPATPSSRPENVLPTLIIAAKSNNFRLIRDLLAAGANVNVKDAQARSALWYAFEYENFEAFRILLENGATPDFMPNDKPVASSKRIFYHLTKEHELFNKIKYPGNNDPSLFDMYFSKFSNGYYFREADRIFEKIVRNDYYKSVTSGNLKGFLKKYSNMGQNYYLIVANDLNIRASDSVNTAVVGKYTKGEKIFAKAVRRGWIQTERGWINAKYTKQIKKRIPALQPYLQKAALKLGHKPPVARPADPKTNEPRQSGVAPRRTRQRKNVSEVETELNRILENPTLPQLEAFINKYKNNQKYHSVVKRAKEKYKKILLKDL